MNDCMLDGVLRNLRNKGEREVSVWKDILVMVCFFLLLLGTFLGLCHAVLLFVSVSTSCGSLGSCLVLEFFLTQDGTPMSRIGITTLQIRGDILILEALGRQLTKVDQMTGNRGTIGSGILHGRIGQNRHAFVVACGWNRSYR